MTPPPSSLSSSQWASDISDSQAPETPLELSTFNDSWPLGAAFSDDSFSAGGFVDQEYPQLEATQFDSDGLYHPAHLSNALGLDHDPLSISPRIIETDPSLHDVYSPQSQHSRVALPQIVTSSLSPHFPSPLDHTRGLYSAYSPSPSSSGHGPLTPASLPGTQLMPPTMQSALLSPTTPYAWPYQSPVPKSPYTLSPSVPRSPSSMSHVSYSPSEELASPPITQRRARTVPTVQELAAKFPHAEHIVPQRTYKPHTQSDRRRYVEEVNLEEPIMFYMANPDECGIPCRDALNCRFARLCGRDDQMFVQRGPSVSIRIMWPGYAPWSRQIPTRDFRSPPGPITRSKLAKNVAKTVQRFIEDMKTKPLEEDADPRWKLGNNSITLDDLELVGLQHVSMGSWQLHLRLSRRR
jgi:hypothetical protein